MIVVRVPSSNQSSSSGGTEGRRQLDRALKRIASPSDSLRVLWLLRHSLHVASYGTRTFSVHHLCENKSEPIDPMPDLVNHFKLSLSVQLYAVIMQV